jgi:hypothetical protein
MDDHDLCQDRGFITSTAVHDKVNMLDCHIREDGAAAANTIPTKTIPNRIFSDRVGLELQPGLCLEPY